MMLGHPKLIEFNKKYKVLLNHWRNGYCNMQEVLEAIEILDKFGFYKEDN